jgi:hypothetical protein
MSPGGYETNVPGACHNGGDKEAKINIGEIQAMLGEVLAPLEIVPNDAHGYFSYTKNTRASKSLKIREQEIS